ncbi:hypothetical protein PROFUN_06107 [Planoprotostelium fungivorum]|uniref:Hemerythrin-like domain-containing protein n=1 Tax=Planoprotostelium fungivorum TaxID=1890364 RepID=A0A2P6NPF1_9EUKA|nr:hypothetical protein PROFUN_06107 [Planoprotostelium fungivorum]
MPRGCPWNGLQDMMLYYHNHFRSNTEKLYKYADRVDEIGWRSYLNTARTLDHHLHMHHSIEEQHIFPILARKMPKFAKDHIDEHKHMNESLSQMRQYVEQGYTDNSNYHPEEMKKRLDALKTALFDHLAAEEKSLGEEEMKKYWTEEEMEDVAYLSIPVADGSAVVKLLASSLSLVLRFSASIHSDLYDTGGNDPKCNDHLFFCLVMRQYGLLLCILLGLSITNATIMSWKNTYGCYDHGGGNVAFNTSYCWDSGVFPSAGDTAIISLDRRFLIQASDLRIETYGVALRIIRSTILGDIGVFQPVIMVVSVGVLLIVFAIFLRVRSITSEPLLFSSRYSWYILSNVSKLVATNLKSFLPLHQHQHRHHTVDRSSTNYLDTEVVRWLREVLSEVNFISAVSPSFPKIIDDKRAPRPGIEPGSQAICTL